MSLQEIMMGRLKTEKPMTRTLGDLDEPQRSQVHELWDGL